MNAARAYARLSSFGPPVVRTSEAAALLGLSAVSAAQSLRRLSASGLLKPLRHGLFWVAAGPIDPWVALGYIAAPYPAYASLYSALYLRGALSQLPVVHYAVTLGRSQRVATSAGDFSLHHVAPELFDGFESLPSGARLATLEKAFFDVAYLAGTRSRLFSRPPELDLPKGFQSAQLRLWLRRIPNGPRRVQTERRLAAMLG